MLWILTCLFLSTPQGTVTGSVVPPVYLPLYQAAADFSSGQEPQAFVRLKALLEPMPADPDGTVPPEPPERRAARMLLTVHHACTGRLDRARVFLDTFTAAEKEQLTATYLGKRVISVRPVLTGDDFWAQIDGMLGVYTRCRPDGLLLFADHLYAAPGPRRPSSRPCSSGSRPCSPAIGCQSSPPTAASRPTGSWRPGAFVTTGCRSPCPWPSSRPWRN
ncbi:hypothetical protein KJ975_00705 [Myxococcota bacterium]|nr:hypothetical protein [Myxococcota bacterium]